MTSGVKNITRILMAEFIDDVAAAATLAANARGGITLIVHSVFSPAVALV